MSWPKELALHIPVAKLLDDHLLEDWRYTHIPSGELRDIRTASKLKAMGLKKGWFDLELINPRGFAHFLELKRAEDSKLTEDQEKFRQWCIRCGIPHAVAWTMEQVLFTLDCWGCLRIKLGG